MTRWKWLVLYTVLTVGVVYGFYQGVASQKHNGMRVTVTSGPNPYYKPAQTAAPQAKHYVPIPVEFSPKPIAAPLTGDPAIPTAVEARKLSGEWHENRKRWIREAVAREIKTAAGSGLQSCKYYCPWTEEEAAPTVSELQRKGYAVVSEKLAGFVQYSIRWEQP